MNNIVKNFNAVLFDMDGVLIDSNSVIERAWCEVAQMYDREISNDEMIKHIHDQPGPHTFQHYLAICHEPIKKKSKTI